MRYIFSQLCGPRNTENLYLRPSDEMSLTTQQQRLDIKRLSAAGYSQRKIAEILGRSKTFVYNALHSKGTKILLYYGYYGDGKSLKKNDLKNIKTNVHSVTITGGPRSTRLMRAETGSKIPRSQISA